MPIYRYVCKRCGAEFRELVTRGDGDWVRCSACGSSQVTR
ncbi:MAG TPA: zinc ribbon domain-containing protein, partial [Candidatus Acetothermia bacterium]|nr:zinc ribbon domain-containing protein [Candidatus Acetothermia bacterium]